MKLIGLSITLLFISVLSYGQSIRSGNLEYRHKDVILEGYLAYDTTLTGKQPVVIVVHEWIGINEYILKRCEQLAELGYVAFAADVYGKGIRPKAPDAAAKESSKYKNNRQLLRDRMLAAFETAKKLPNADPDRIAVIGYCFGGTAALELARSGAPVKGTVSFHGGLANPNPEDTKNIKGSVLILHGAIDPYVPKAEVDTFISQMNRAGVDYQFTAFSNAVHSFTNPAAGTDNSKGAAYNAKADRRSWADMRQFLSEVFRRP